MASQGPLSPGTVTSNAAGDQGWDNPGNVVSSNNTYASATLSGETTDYLRSTNFSFTIPTGSTIDGIVVEFEADGDTAGPADIQDLEVKIRGFPGGATAVDHVRTISINGGDTYYRYPASGNTDKWITGGIWTAALVNNTAFGVDYRGQEVNGKPADIRVDHVRVTVYYTPPTQPAGIMMRMY